MSFHFCYFAHFCSFLCILTNPASEIPLLLFINIRQFPCFETMGRFSLSPCKKECALAHSRAEARLPRQPSTPAPSAHPRGAFLSYGNEVSYTMKKNVPWHILAPRRGCFSNHLPLRRVRILAERLLSYGNEVSNTMRKPPYIPAQRFLCFLFY